MASPTIRSLKGMVLFVTGAASGLGRATLERALREGARGVVAFDRLPQFEHNSQTQKFEKNLVHVAGDVTSEEDVDNAIDKCVSQFGRLDATVNCAGVGVAIRTYNAKKGLVHDLSAFEQVISINLNGTFNVNRLAARAMSKNDAVNGLRGVLINTASVAAFEGQIGQAAYSASKGGICGMTLPMARDLASLGIRVNTIAPGLFLTPLLEQLPAKVKEDLGKSVPCPQRLGISDEYAHTVQFLIENPMMNGAVIRVDGALRMQP